MPTVTALAATAGAGTMGTTGTIGAGAASTAAACETEAASTAAAREGAAAGSRALPPRSAAWAASDRRSRSAEYRRNWLSLALVSLDLDFGNCDGRESAPTVCRAGTAPAASCLRG